MNVAVPVFLARFHRDLHHHHNHHVAGEEERRRRRPAERRLWIRNWLTEDRRRELGHYYTLLDLTMANFDERMFRNYTRLTPGVFLEVLDLIRPAISKEDTRMRQAIEPGLKLAVTLRYLATGDNYRSLCYAFRIGVSTISTFLPAVCRAITEAFNAEVFPEEWTEDRWKTIADKFYTRWNMPHTMGALDGKHVAIKKPSNSGSLYHNYKGYFSIPMLALVDADYKFQWVEFGGIGHMSDAQIFLETDLRQDLEDGSINRPAPCLLTDDPEDTTDVPYYIISDDAFALKDYCMKPYSRHSMSPKELIFNYRLSRARRVVENAFGLLAQRFRVMLSTCELIPENARTVMKCCTTLHNLLLDRLPSPKNAVDREDAHMNVLPGAWREHVIWPEQPQPRAGRANTDGKKVRETLADFFGSPVGIVPWQWDKASVHQPPGAANPNRNPAAAAASPQAESAPPSPAPSSPQ